MNAELSSGHWVALVSRLGAISHARRGLGRDPGAEAQIRREVQALRSFAATYRFPDIYALASRIEQANTEQFPPRVEELVQILRQLVGGVDATKTAILIVEDNPTERGLLADALATPDREILVTSTGGEARKVLETRPVALVVLNLSLPDMDGRNLLILMRNWPATTGTPVLVMADSTGSATRAECLTLGADAFLPKPVDLDIVRSLVTAQLRLATPTPAKSPSSAPAVDPSPAERAITPEPMTLPEIVAEELALPEIQLAETQPGMPAAAAMSAGLQSKTILLVENDQLTAEILIHRLAREGYEVIHHTTGSAVLERAAEEIPAMAILEVKVPGMDGFELLTRLRRIPAYESIPIMLLTGMGGERDVLRGFEKGADDYMVKPFSPRELIARVNRLLKRR